MNIFKAVGSLFTRSKTTDDFLDSEKGHLAKLGRWIDGQQFTDQERAKNIEAVAEAVREFSIKTANECTDRSRTRRDLARLWIFAQLTFVTATFIAGGLNHPQAEFFWKIATSDLMFYGTAGVMIYFFGAYGWGAHVGKK